jgi:hypothetical protein
MPQRVFAMTEHTTVETRDALLELGFRCDDTVISDVMPGLSFDFGNFKLQASCVTNLRAAEVVLFTGVLTTPRTMAEIDFELPRRVESRNQCAAFIVWYLDEASSEREFRPQRDVGWIEEGRQNRKLLPGVRVMGAYNSRPSCTVRRDWMRLALNTLREHISYLTDSAPVVFCFDGSVLSIRLEREIVALAGQGLPWAVCFSVKAGELRRLPKRFKRECVKLSIWESRLTIDGWRYEGTIEAYAPVGRAGIQ